MSDNKTLVCSACGGDTKGFKCGNCGREGDGHPVDCDCDDMHSGAMCSGCKEVHVKCSCGA